LSVSSKKQGEEDNILCITTAGAVAKNLRNGEPFLNAARGIYDEMQISHLQV